MLAHERIGEYLIVRAHDKRGVFIEAADAGEQLSLPRFSFDQIELLISSKKLLLCTTKVETRFLLLTSPHLRLRPSFTHAEFLLSFLQLEALLQEGLH